MKIGKYLTDKSIYVVFNLISVVFISLLLKLLNVDIAAISLIAFIWIMTFLFTLVHEYSKKRAFYKEVVSISNNFEKNHLLSEMIEAPGFSEGDILYEVLKKSNKSMNDEIFSYSKNVNEYKDYIEMWVHEVKTPIAALKLIIENNREKGVDGMSNAIDRIEKYVDQVLFYARISEANKDYLIKECNLKDIVNTAIKKNSPALIQLRSSIETEKLDYKIYTDSKWIEFIIGQIIVNSIKYMEKDHKSLSFRGRETNGEIILTIEDNGIGINEKDIGKIFEKGYTGENGRRFAKSTGMGLYICKRLCDKLGIEISIASNYGEGTSVSLWFPVSKKGKLQS